MFKPLSLFIGLRYVRAKRRNHFISVISLISMLGIGLGVTVLITVLSVMNGFDKEIKERILGMMPHVLVLGYDGEIKDWQKALDAVAKQPYVQEVTPFVETQGMLSTPGVTRFVSATGIDPALEDQRSFLAKHMVEGRLDLLQPDRFNIVLGKQLAAGLNVDVGDAVTFAIPEASLTPAGLVPRFKRFHVVGIFEVDYDYDASFAYIHMSDAQKLLRYQGGVTGLNVKIDSIYNANADATKLYQVLDNEFRVYDWTVLNGTFFEAVKLEKKMMTLILGMIIAVAAFNILSMLVMAVTDKQADIAILRTMGAMPNTIMHIFVVQGTIIGVVGTILGVVGGVLLALNVTALVAWLETAVGVQFISSDVYYISFLPSQLLLSDVLKISLLSFSLSFIATWYPAWRASKTQPAEALRYE